MKLVSHTRRGALALCFATLASITVVPATTVVNQEHACPVCETPSLAPQLGSYSLYEPAKDLSDQIMFAFNDPDICPNDLYAALNSGWEKVTPEDKTALDAFLKDPALVLTPEEKQIVGDHLDELHRSAYMELLWTRSCQGVRQKDPRTDWLIAMKLVYMEPAAKRPWEKKLAGEFREQAIRLLREGRTSSWATESDKRVLPYLLAEFTRQAGHDRDAKALFLDVIDGEKKLPHDEDTAWISDWSAEQIKGIDAGAATDEILAGWCLPAMPDPWRDSAAGLPPGWLAHKVALRELQRRALAGDAGASGILWKLLDRKPARLIAMLESEADPDIHRLAATNADWRAWFDELGKNITARKLPDLGKEDSNPERVFNVLSAVVPEPFGEEWRKQVLLPESLRALEKGGLPKVAQTGGKLLYSLSELLETQEPADQLSTAKIMLRVYRSLNLDKSDLNDLSKYPCKNLAALDLDRAALASELQGDWKNVFWKALCETMLGIPGAEKRLAAMPEGGKLGKPQQEIMTGIIGALFETRKIPLWKSKVSRLIQNNGRLPDYAIAYAFALDDPDLTKLLEPRIKRRTNTKAKAPLSQLADFQNMEIQNRLVTRRLAALPVR